MSESLNQNSIDVNRKKNIAQNIYYLSGYIIECSVKFGIYRLYNHPQQEDIKSFNKCGFTYREHINHHKFRRHILLISKFSITAPFLSSFVQVNKNEQDLFDNWDVNVRYYCDGGYSCEDYVNFLDIAEKIFYAIKERTIG